MSTGKRTPLVLMIAGVVATGLVSVACCDSFEPERLPSFYEWQYGESRLTLTGSESEEVAAILKNHAGVYAADFVSYAPHHVFRNKNIIVNHLGKTLIVNYAYREGSFSGQVRIDISDDERARLERLETGLFGEWSAAHPELPPILGSR